MTTRRGIPVIVFAFGFAITLLAGVGIGWQLSSRVSPVAQPAVTAAVPILDSANPLQKTEDRLRKRIVESEWENVELSSQLNFLQSILKGASVDGGEARDLIRATIAKLDDDQIAAVISMTTQIKPEALQEIQNLSSFAVRLADIAMDGPLTETEASEPGPTYAISFHSSVRDFGSGADSLRRIASDGGRLFAIFPTNRYPLDQVMVKWFRTDAPEIMLMKRYPINIGKDHNWVWFDPEEGWSPGSYQVDVYSGDEAMEKFAVGRYIVTESTSSERI